MPDGDGRREQHPTGRLQVRLFAGAADGDAAAQVTGVGGPLLRGLGEQLQDDAVEESGEFGPVGAQWLRLGVAVSDEDAPGVVEIERRRSGGDLVQHAAQRVEVAAVVDLAAADLLGRHVVGVPMAMPTPVRREVTLMSWPSLAIPKSQIFTVPSASRMMLAGLRSRWTMPCWWV